MHSALLTKKLRFTLNFIKDSGQEANAARIT